MKVLEGITVAGNVRGLLRTVCNFTEQLFGRVSGISRRVGVVRGAGRGGMVAFMGCLRSRRIVEHAWLKASHMRFVGPSACGSPAYCSCMRCDAPSYGQRKAPLT